MGNWVWIAQKLNFKVSGFGIVGRKSSNVQVQSRIGVALLLSLDLVGKKSLNAGDKRPLRRGRLNYHKTNVSRVCSTDLIEICVSIEDCFVVSIVCWCVEVQLSIRITFYKVVFWHTCFKLQVSARHHSWLIFHLQAHIWNFFLFLFETCRRVNEKQKKMALNESGGKSGAKPNKINLLIFTHTQKCDEKNELWFLRFYKFRASRSFGLISNAAGDRNSWLVKNVKNALKYVVTVHCRLATFSCQSGFALEWALIEIGVDYRHPRLFRHNWSISKKSR